MWEKYLKEDNEWKLITNAIKGIVLSHDMHTFRMLIKL